MIPSYLGIWLAVQRHWPNSKSYQECNPHSFNIGPVADFKILRKKAPHIPQAPFMSCLHFASLPIPGRFGLLKSIRGVWQRAQPGSDPILGLSILAHRSASHTWDRKSHVLLLGGRLGLPATSRSIKDTSTKKPEILTSRIDWFAEPTSKTDISWKTI